MLPGEPVLLASLDHFFPRMAGGQDSLVELALVVAQRADCRVTSALGAAGRLATVATLSAAQQEGAAMRRGRRSA